MATRKRQKKQQKFMTVAFIVLIAAVSLALIFLFTYNNQALPAFAGLPSTTLKGDVSDPPYDLPNINGWPLNYIHPDYPMTGDANIELALAPGDEYVDARILEPLLSMFEAAALEGLIMYVNSGYRSVANQAQIYDARINSYIEAGYSKEDAISETQKWVALPGRSEHALGIAVDITADEITTTDWEVYSWLATNAHNFGFTLSFPADRVLDTGVAYEPWHYRYVGLDAAVYMYENELLLNEYLEIFY